MTAILSCGAGTKAWGEVILAGTERVALDAVGLAILGHRGYSAVAANGPIVAQEQIARAVELGLGADCAEKSADNIGVFQSFNSMARLNSCFPKIQNRDTKESIFDLTGGSLSQSISY